jgi:high-affinity iron transporter
MISFREFFEIGLAWVIITKLLEKSNNVKQKLFTGLFIGVVTTLLVVLIFNYFNVINKNSQMITEAVMSLVAALVLMFILRSITKDNKIQLNNNYIEYGFAIIVFRELTEVALFAKIGNYSALTLIYGLITGLAFTVLFAKLQNRLKTEKIMKVLTIILILQIGYLVGYALHEIIQLTTSSDSILRWRIYDLSNSPLDNNHFLGALMNGIFGWYYKPELIMFLTQYIISVTAITYYIRKGAKWKITIKS